MLRTFFVFVFSIVLFACQGTPSGEPISEKDSAHHHHQAPHGGALVALGEERAHLELVLDPTGGELTVYLLDGEAENAVPSSNSQGLQLGFQSPFQGEVTLLPVADPLTGETEEDTSVYRATVEGLKDAKEFSAVLKSVTLKGEKFEQVDLQFPFGNEHHDHDH